MPHEKSYHIIPAEKAARGTLRTVPPTGERYESLHNMKFPGRLWVPGKNSFTALPARSGTRSPSAPPGRAGRRAVPRSPRACRLPHGGVRRPQGEEEAQVHTADAVGVVVDNPDELRLAGPNNLRLLRQLPLQAPPERVAAGASVSSIWPPRPRVSRPRRRDSLPFSGGAAEKPRRPCTASHRG